jgi:hypothetical protein
MAAPAMQSFFFTSAKDPEARYQEPYMIRAQMHVPVELKTADPSSIEVGVLAASLWDVTASGTSSYLIVERTAAIGPGIPLNGEPRGIIAIVPKAAAADYRPKNIAWAAAPGLAHAGCYELGFELVDERCRPVSAVGAWCFTLAVRFRSAAPPAYGRS